MARTEVRGGQVKDASIQRADLDVTTSGQAVITKVIPGAGASLSSTGADAGTGDVTISCTAPAGGAITIAYTFSTTTTDSDPGNGTLRLNQATQNTSTVIRADLLDSGSTDWTTVLDTFDDSTSVVKGQLRLFKASDTTKWLEFNVSSIASPSGYKNITVVLTGSSAASPFANADAIILTFTRTGDAGSTGATGPKPDGSISVGGAGMWPSTTSGAGYPVQIETVTNLVNYIGVPFSDSASKLYAEFALTMPSDWNAGTITATFRWLAAGTSTNSVVWGLQGLARGDLETMDTAFGTAQEATDAHSSTADQVQITAATAAITLAGTPAAGDLVQFRVYRDSANGSDTLAQTVYLLAIQITFTRT